MAHVTTRDRIAEVRGPGTLLVTSDLHGNLSDFRRMVELFEREDDAVLFLLGDFVHGPNLERTLWEQEYPYLGDWYPDESPQLFEELAALMERYPERVACLLGNHEHGHVGGAIVAKFHPDEATALESRMAPEERSALVRFIQKLPWVASTSCGIALTHAAPPDAPFDRATLRDARLDGWDDMPPWRMLEAGFLGEVVWRRGASEALTRRFLSRLNDLDVPGPSTVVIHGHEVERTGYEVENPCLLNLSTSFGMKRARKTWLKLDLSERYANAAALRPGVELLPLWDHDL